MQVKRHRDKRRKRREARAATAAAAAAADGAGWRLARGVRRTLASVAVALALAAPASAALPPLGVRATAITAGGRPVLLHGVNRSGLEYACITATASSTAPTRHGSTTRR